MITNQNIVANNVVIQNQEQINHNLNNCYNIKQQIHIPHIYPKKKTFFHENENENTKIFVNDKSTEKGTNGFLSDENKNENYSINDQILSCSHNTNNGIDCNNKNNYNIFKNNKTEKFIKISKQKKFFKNTPKTLKECIDIFTNTKKYCEKIKLKKQNIDKNEVELNASLNLIKNKMCFLFRNKKKIEEEQKILNIKNYILNCYNSILYENFYKIKEKKNLLEKTKQNHFITLENILNDQKELQKMINNFINKKNENDIIKEDTFFNKNKKCSLNQNYIDYTQNEKQETENTQNSEPNFDSSLKNASYSPKSPIYGPSSPQ